MDIKELIILLREPCQYENCILSYKAADTIEKLSAENKQLRTDLIVQTALAQNGQSAIETNRLLTKKLQAAMAEIKELASKSENVCDYCKNYQLCEKKQCKYYVEGVGAEDDKGRHIDWKWTCMDFDYGTCPKMENTPCNGCMDSDDSGFEWRGVKDE